MDDDRFDYNEIIKDISEKKRKNDGIKYILELEQD